MLGLFIVLYGLEGIYLHVSVWIAQKESQFREISTSRRGGWVCIFLGPRTQNSPDRRFKCCKIVFRYTIRVFQQNSSYYFHPNAQKFLHLNMPSEKPSEASGNCGVLP